MKTELLPFPRGNITQLRAASQLAPPLYYSTLGFDADLIDYLSFIKDEYIRFLFPRPIVL